MSLYLFLLIVTHIIQTIIANRLKYQWTESDGITSNGRCQCSICKLKTKSSKGSIKPHNKQLIHIEKLEYTLNK